MPWFATIALPLLSLGATGAGIGLAASGAGQPSSGDAAAMKQLQQARQQQAQQDALARQRAIQANLANAQEQSGGYVGPTSLVDLASIIAGMPGSATGSEGRAALGAYLGTPGTTITAGGVPSGDTMMGATQAALSGSQQG